MATYTATQTVETIKVSYFKATSDEISIYGARAGVSGSSANSGKIYGVNGSFFQTSTLELYGLAVNNGVAVTSTSTFNVKRLTQNGVSYGGTNNHSDLDCFLCGTKTKIGSYKVRIAYTSSFPFYTATSPIESITISDARWAIGGHNLNLGTSFSTETAFYNKIHPVAISSYSAKNKTQRTFIGSNGNDVWICIAPDGCTFYDEYKVLRKLGCNIGLNLDGGGSTFISHKGGYNQPVSGSRKVPTMVRVNY